MRFCVSRTVAVGLIAISCAAAENRALLIGIRSYPKYPGLRSLEGPVNDVLALAASLQKNWGFPEGNIKLLLEEQGTRANILGALDELVAKTRPGDRVVVFYSGHGTSFHDTNTQGFGMDLRTGAIIPQDLAAGTPAQVLDGLIVGSRDLRPRFLQLERKAELIVLFDACYSGDSAKSVPRLISREAPLFSKASDATQRDFDSKLDALLTKTQAASPDDWPYRQVVYVSAAARHEQAWDIPTSVIQGGVRKTMDGKPHGAFTNGLLEGLAGAADLDHDGRITYRELHNFLLQSIQVQYGQTPQLFPKGLNHKLVDAPVFGTERAPAGTNNVGSDGVLVVKVEANAPELVAGLKGNPHVRLSEREYQVRAIADGAGLAVEHATGGRIFAGTLSQPEALRLIRNLAYAQQVSGLRFPRQDFNVTLTVEKLLGDRAETAGVFEDGDHVRLRMIPDQPCYLLLADVDVEGRLTMLYPVNEAELRRASKGEVVEAGASMVNAPFGTEFLKLFAFREKPPGYDGLIRTPAITGPEAIQSFLAMVAGDGTGRSQTLQITFSKPRS